MKPLILSIIAFAAVSGAQAQSVADILKSVESNNVGLQAMQRSNEATMLEVRSENNLEDPSVEYSPFFSGGVSGVASSELIVKQGFDFPTLYSARRKANRLQGEVLDMEYRTARRDILFEANTLCLDLICMNKQASLLAERRAAADEMLASLTRKYDNGEATALEINKVKMERMNLETELLQAETGRTAALKRLEALNGGRPVSLITTEYPALPAESDEAMYARAVSADLSVMSAQASVRAAEQDIKVNRRGWIPKIEVGYRRNTEGDEAVNGFLVGASIPIFSSRNKVKTAKARHAEAQLRRTDARIKAESEARRLTDEMARLRTAVAAYDVPLMRQTLQLLRTAVDNGEISIIDYYAEADNIFRNILSFIDVERQYHGIVAEICKNDL